MKTIPLPVNDLYADLIEDILAYGQDVTGRNGLTKELQDVNLTTSFDHGFPIVSLRHISFPQTVGEYCAFMRGYDTVKQFQELGCDFWEPNGNDPLWQSRIPSGFPSDWLGNIYGVQWRTWSGWYDQMAIVKENLIRDPQSRRHIISNYNPAEQVCLPPCHMMYQFLLEGDQLNIIVTQRSLDVVIGLPYDWTLFGLLLLSLAKETGYNPGRITINIGSAHIYADHFGLLKSLLANEPFKNHVCSVEVNDAQWEFLYPHPDDYILFDYPTNRPRPAFKMVV